MSCMIAAANVKIFGKAFHALARIAEDLYIEALASGLVFHTVNSSKSAYACFTFKPDFFITYKDESSEKRKVLLKSCLTAFRSLPSLEKTVEKCLFDLTCASDYLLLKFFCKHGMIKVYQLHFVDKETVQGSFPTGGFFCKFSAPSRLLQDSIQNFSSSVEEITLNICSNKVHLKNYVDDEPDPNKVVHTELILEPEEFDFFEVDQEMKLTFCLKELKAILNFCDGFNVPIAIKGQGGGRPVTFSVTSLRGVDVQFVLATLVDRDSLSVSSSFRNPIAQISQHRETESLSQVKKNKDFAIDLNSSTSTTNCRTADSSNGVKKQSKIIVCLSDDDDDESNLNSNEIMLEADNEVVPSTPPHKKFRSMFLGLSQATYTTIAPDPDEVLVVASDEENV